MCLVQGSGRQHVDWCATGDKDNNSFVKTLPAWFNRITVYREESAHCGPHLASSFSWLHPSEVGGECE